MSARSSFLSSRAASKLAAYSVILQLLTNIVSGMVLFQDDFESGSLALWTGKYAGPDDGIIVADPLNSQNHVLSFNALNANGDVYTVQSLAISDPTGPVHLSFDYLGLTTGSVPPSGLGGFIGIIAGFNYGPGAWLAGTDLSAANGLGRSGILLDDDGIWHHYDIDLTPYVQAYISAVGSNTVHLMAEDWSGSGGTAGDILFDNITLTVIPEPLQFIFPVGVLALAIWKRTRSKDIQDA